MSERAVIAYLTSSYARATDTFIRDEVRELRELGDTVLTFSIRKSADSEVVNEQVATERASTTYLLELPLLHHVRCLLADVLRRPVKTRRAIGLAARLSRPGLRGRLWPVFYLLEASSLAHFLRVNRVQHLHNHIGEGSAAVAMLGSALTGVSFSFTVHGPSEWDAPQQHALDVKSHAASFVAVISDFTRGQLMRWIDARDWAKVRIVRCGLDHRAYLTAPDRADTDSSVTLVCVGRLSEEKGHLVLLDSLRAVPTEGLDVILIGDGPQRSTLEAFVRDHRLESVVTFAGWRDSEAVRDALRSSTALVMPSFAEGLPVAIMEAFALGKPVIGTDVAAVAELVRTGETGWLVTPGSTRELAEALRAVHSSSAEHLSQLGARGRALVRDRHDLHREMRTLRDLMHAAIRGEVISGPEADAATPPRGKRAGPGP